MRRCKQRELGADLGLAGLFVAGLVAVLAAPAASGQDFGVFGQVAEHHSRGFDPAKTYSFGDVDSVSTFNGALTLAIPIGSGYPQDGGGSFGLTLVYNSNAWDYKSFSADELRWVGDPPEPHCSAYAQAWPSWQFNAGLGWQLSLGKLYEPGPGGDMEHEDDVPGVRPVNVAESWRYIGPDGRAHDLGTDLHLEPQPSPVVPVDPDPPFPGPGEPEMAPLYSRDGSYLRLRCSATGQAGCLEYQLQMPDGSSTFFEKPLLYFDDPQLWRAVRRVDPFGNTVTVDYEATCAGNPCWKITDAHNRVYEVHLSLNDPLAFGIELITKVVVPGLGGTRLTYLFDYQDVEVARGFNDSYPWGRTWNPPNDSPWDCSDRWIGVRLLERVRLAGLPGAEWRFDYDYVPSAPAPQGCPVAGSANRGSGELRAVTAPTGGRVAWEYGTWAFPKTQECHPDAPPPLDGPFACGLSLEWSSVTLGVRERIVYDVDGEELGRWSYFPRLRDDAAPTAPLCQRFRELRTTVVDPHGNRSEHFYSTYVQGPDDGLGWRPDEYGLPFTRRERITPAGAGGPLFLSRRSWNCADAADRDPGTTETNCSLFSSHWLRYEIESGPAGYCAPNGQGPAVCPAANSRPEAEQTQYHGAGGAVLHWSQNVAENFDGLGNYRQRTAKGNLCQGTGAAEHCSGDHRVEYTEFNPGSGTLVLAADGTVDPQSTFVLPADVEHPQHQWDRWLFHDFSYRSVREPGAGREELTSFAFEATGSGFLYATRQHADTTPGAVARSANDLVTVFERDGRGNPIRTCRFGGDGNPLPPDLQGQGLPGLVPDLCGPTPSGQRCDCDAADYRPDYRLDQTFAHGVLRRASAVNPWAPSETLPLVRHEQPGGAAAIDPSTGLVLRSADAADVGTALQYDAFSRLVGIQPQGSASSVVEYVMPAGGSPASVRVGRPDLACEQANRVCNEVVFDGFGRVAVQRARMPQGWSRSEHTYFADGSTRSVTTPFLEDAAVRGATEFKGYQDTEPLDPAYDVLGRPKRVVAPDGSRVVYSYRGVDRRKVDVPGVALLGGGGLELGTQTRFEYRDRHGRLWKIEDRSDPLSTSDVATFYTHDVGDRLTGVVMGAQQRTLQFDGRSLLMWESHPELGTAAQAGWGATYDAAGQLLLRGLWDDGEEWRLVSRAYDFAGRPIHESVGATSKDYFYARTNRSASNKEAGKLVQTRSTVDLPLPDGPPFLDHPVTVTETMRYEGPGGRLSSRTQRLFDPYEPRRGLRFLSAYTWDGLGNVSGITYPRCEGTASCPAADPATSVAFTYDRGFLTGVTAQRGGQSHILASAIGYDPSGLAVRLDHGPADGVVDVVAPDPDGLPRPASIATTGVGGGGWSSGAYSWDGAGNPYKIGGDDYYYDRVNRLVEARVRSAGGLAVQRYDFDRYGNLVRTRTDDDLSPNPGDPNETVVTTATDAASNHLLGHAYDSAGNLLSALSFQQIDYDGFDRPWRMTGQQVHELYAYTAGGERLATFDLIAGRELWTPRGLGNQVLRDYERTAGGWTAKDYVHLGTRLLASLSSAGRRSYHLDHLGSPRLVTDGAGNRVAQHVYLPYGREITPRGVDGERLRFTGHERDVHSEGQTAGNPERDDLDYMHARYYSPWLGRFFSVDSHLGFPANPQSFNRYSYVYNRPTLAVDPTGQVPVPTCVQCLVLQQMAFDWFVDDSGYEQGVRGRGSAFFQLGLGGLGFLKHPVGWAFAAIGLASTLDTQVIQQTGDSIGGHLVGDPKIAETEKADASSMEESPAVRTLREKLAKAEADTDRHLGMMMAQWEQSNNGRGGYSPSFIAAAFEMYKASKDRERRLREEIDRAQAALKQQDAVPPIDDPKNRQ